MSAGGRQTGRTLRPVHACAFSVVGLAVGLLGHVLGGGRVDDVLALTLPSLFFGVAIGLFVSAEAWTATRVTLALLAQQSCAHVLAWIMSSPLSTSAGPGAVKVEAVAAAHQHAVFLTPRMLTVHLLAASAYAAVLVLADRALSLLVGWVRRASVSAGNITVPALRLAPLTKQARLASPRLLQLCVMRSHAPPVVAS